MEDSAGEDRAEDRAGHVRVGAGHTGESGELLETTVTPDRVVVSAVTTMPVDGFVDAWVAAVGGDAVGFAGSRVLAMEHQAFFGVLEADYRLRAMTSMPARIPGNALSFAIVDCANRFIAGYRDQDAGHFVQFDRCGRSLGESIEVPEMRRSGAYLYGACVRGGAMFATEDVAVALRCPTEGCVE